MSVFWTTGELHRRGKSNRQIRRAVTDRVMREVRRGHFAAGAVDAQVLRAVRVGGIATASTATRAVGIWTPPDIPPGSVIRRGARPPDILRVAVPQKASRLRDPDDASAPLTSRSDVVLHWTRLH